MVGTLQTARRHRSPEGIYAHTEKARINLPNQGKADGEIIHDKNCFIRTICRDKFAPWKVGAVPTGAPHDTGAL